MKPASSTECRFVVCDSVITLPTADADFARSSLNLSPTRRRRLGSVLSYILTRKPAWAVQSVAHTLPNRSCTQSSNLKQQRLHLALRRFPAGSDDLRRQFTNAAKALLINFWSFGLPHSYGASP